MRSTWLALCLLAASSSPALAFQQTEESESYFNVAQLHLRDGRPKMAVEQFEKALKIDSKNPYAMKGLGIAYMQLQRYDKAIEAFRKAIELHPHFVDVHNDLGTALVLSGQRAEGRAEFLTAYNDPTNPTPEFAALNLARSYYEEKNVSEALGWYQTAVNRNKKFPDAIQGLASCLVELGRWDDSVRVLEIAAKDNPESPLLQLSLGEAYQRSGRLAEAKALLLEARKLDPVGELGRRAEQLLEGIENQ